MIKKIRRIPGFLREVKEELKKVNWSTRRELVGAAILVIVVMTIFTCYIAAIDLGLSRAIQVLLR